MITTKEEKRRFMSALFSPDTDNSSSSFLSEESEEIKEKETKAKQLGSSMREIMRKRYL